VTVIPIEFVLLAKKIDLKISTLLKIIGVPIFNGILMFVTILMINKIQFFKFNFLVLMIALIVSLIFYILMSFISDKIFNYGFLKLLDKNYIAKVFG